MAESKFREDLLHPSLRSVIKGDKVWIRSLSRYVRNANTKESVPVYNYTMNTATKVDKRGKRTRIYIIDPANIEANDWRYGFDVLTGQAHAYSYYIMIAANPLEVEGYQAEIQALKQAREQAEVFKQTTEYQDYQILACFFNENGAQRAIEKLGTDRLARMVAILGE